LGAEVLLVDCERAPIQRFGLTQTVGVLQQLRQIVEVCGDVRILGAEALSSIANACRIKSSASLNRFVA